MIWEMIQPGHQPACENRLRFLTCEDHKNVKKERSHSAGLMRVVSQAERRLARQLRPMPARQVGQREERFPDIGGPVVQFAWELRAGIRNCLRIITHDAGASALECLSRALQVSQ